MLRSLRYLLILKGGPPTVLARALDILARIESQHGKAAEAEALFRRALALRDQVIHVDHPETAEILEHLAALLRKTGRAGEARAIEDKAQAMRSQTDRMPPAK
jgi:predicted ArsR family transcriptional regulator